MSKFLIKIFNVFHKIIKEIENLIIIILITPINLMIRK